MLKIAICDDDVAMTSSIEELLLNITKRQKIDADIEVFFDGSSLCHDIKNGNKFDLIYLDIKMKKLDGIDTAKIIREYGLESIIIYISSYDSYLRQLFEVEPFRFLDKPINKKQFLTYFNKAYQKIITNSALYQYKFNKEVYRVPIREIMYFESDNRIVYIVTGQNKDRFYGKLNAVEQSIKKSKIVFLRIHQSYLVNYSYIKRMGFTEVELFDGTILPISDDRQKRIRDEYCAFVGGEIID